ncbi:MAG: helix-turn-helix domain-containing protein [Candidatus Bathyarchaeia archaeon]
MTGFTPVRDMLAKRIAGDIVFSSDPGKTMRKWRNILNISQVEVANILDLSPSVISDYETGRRRSPGSVFIKRYVEALLEVDTSRGGTYIRHLARITLDPSDVFIDLREFNVPVSANRITEVVEGEVSTGEELLGQNVFGYTIIDSIKAIQMLSGLDFYRIFGATSERALVFTGVSRGRSPLIAVRISPFKPRMIILHGLKGRSLDPLAINLAKSEGIPLVISKLPKEDDLVEALIRLYKREG